MLNKKELERVIEKEMKAANVPGLSLAVIQGDEVLYAGGFGVTDAEQGGSKVTADTLFRVGSVSKPVTGTMIMKLVEQGKIDLDTPIKTYVPWLTLSDPEAAEIVTMRMLLTHRAGFVNDGDYLGSRDPDGLRRFVREELPHKPLYSKPGELFNYNCFSFDLAGLVAEEVTGRYFADLVRELVFEPLGMLRSTYDPLAAMTYPLALPHHLTPDGYEVIHEMPENVAHYPSFNLMTSANDLLKFAQMHMQAPQTVQEMHKTQVELQSALGYGLGLSFFKVWRNGVWLLTHFGDITSYSANLYISPEDGIAVVIMNNRPFPHDKVIGPILDQLLPDRSAEVPVQETMEADRSLWPSYAGAYIGSTAGLVVVEQAGEDLQATVNGKTLSLRPFQDQYAVYNEDGGREVLIRFVPNGEDPCEYAMVSNTRCRRIDYDPSYTPDPAWLEKYAGTYSHYQYIGPHRFTVEDGQLVFENLEYGEGYKETLLPVAPHLFVGPYTKAVLFQVAEDGSVPSYTPIFGWKMKRI